jgi:hypothetical protein
MGYLLQLLVGAVVGALGGAIMGAPLPAVPTYLDPNSGWLDASPNATVVAAIYLGALCGAVPGTVIGLAVGALKAGKRAGASIGLAVGLLIALPLLIVSHGDHIVSAFGLAFVPLGVIVGTLSAIVTGLIRARRPSHLLE